MKPINVRQHLYCRLYKACLATALLSSAYQNASAADTSGKWETCGWGGGGYFYATVYHPSQKGVIYMGGDVAGVYKTEDNARTWRLINNGLANYGVFSLAVDQKNPNTVYAATEGGLCKSTDAGEHWQLLPNTGKKELRITGEKKLSIRSIAVSPSDSNIVYAGSPGGKVFKSTDGGQNWKGVFERKFEAEDPGVLYVKFDAPFGGMFFGTQIPAGVKPEDCVGVGFSFKGDKSEPKDAFLTVKANGGSYRSKNLSGYFKNEQWQDVVLTSKDFVIEPLFAKTNKEKAKTLPSNPDLSTVSRMDFTCVSKSPSLGRFGKFFYAVTSAPDGKKGTTEKPILLAVNDLKENKTVQSYGKIHAGEPSGGSVYSVAVSAKDPSLVLAATADSGMVMSQDAGQTWRELATPKKASSAAVDPANPNIIYGSFFADGVWKSIDKGQTWSNISAGIIKEFSATEVVVSSANSLDVYVIGAVGWNGGFYMSNDGGKTWTKSSTMTVDTEGDPTLQAVGKGTPPTTPLSTPTNLTINPLNPKELYISANWRSCLSEDGGVTWAERNRGADISCVMDIRFSGDKTYVSAMDEGTFVTEDSGKKWRQLWPLKYTPDFTGHNWRMAVIPTNGEDRIIGTCTPWVQTFPARVVLSEDSGKTFKVTTAGLPDYTLKANTMWGTGYPRALSVDPQNPKIVYLGIDGDPTDGKKGGGVFKSEDGGCTWNQLPNQPASRKMMFGLMVDPTDSKRVFWGAFGNNGGLYCSEDSGGSWKRVFSNEQYVCNVLVTNDGTVFCPGKNLWKSTDHGATWKKLTAFPDGRTIVGMEVHPRDSNTMWISSVAWGNINNGAVFKTTDGGCTWTDITGNLQYVKPMVLRFNPKTNELWAGGVTLHKLKQ